MREEIDALVAQAINEGAAARAAREAMLGHARARQQAILALRNKGLTVRNIAARLGCSPSVVQDAAGKANARH